MAAGFLPWVITAQWIFVPDVTLAYSWNKLGVAHMLHTTQNAAQELVSGIRTDYWTSDVGGHVHWLVQPSKGGFPGVPAAIAPHICTTTEWHSLGLWSLVLLCFPFVLSAAEFPGCRESRSLTAGNNMASSRIEGRLEQSCVCVIGWLYIDPNVS